MRNRYLLALSDRLATLTSADTIRDAAAQLLCEHLAASRSYFTEYDLERKIAWVSAEYLCGEPVPARQGAQPAR